MSALIGWVLDNLSSVVPAIIAAGLFVMNSLNKSKLNSEKAKNVVVTQKAEGERVRAEIAEHAIKIVSEKNKTIAKEVKDAVNKAKSNRSDFFN